MAAVTPREFFAGLGDKMPGARILAIDPGQDLGWATNATGRLEWGRENFHVKSGESSGNRWRRFGMWLLDATSDRVIAGEPQNIVIDVIVYELKTFTPQGRAHAGELYGGFKSRLEEHCERHGIALQPVPVATLKSFAIPRDARRKKGDPKTDRSKEAMIEAAMKRWNNEHAQSAQLWLQKEIVEGPSGRKEHWPLTDDEADALWLYWWGKENCR
jgi:hypothetical protein